MVVSLQDKSRNEFVYPLPIWELNIDEITSMNLETRVRRKVNAMLKEGWILLHVYTLTYQEKGVWRERPMGIFGKRRNK